MRPPVIAKDYDGLCREAVRRIEPLARDALRSRDRFTMAISGGSTPEGVYLRMADSSFGAKLPWEKIHIFWADERWVSPGDPQSNYHLVARSLLSKVPLPARNIHRIPLAGDLESAAHAYEKEMVSFFKAPEGEVPIFDLILLGLGTDGHTASLFPGHPALFETERLALPVTGEEIGLPRITLTLPVINQARCVIFLVSGRGKAVIVKKIFEEEKTDLPACRIKLKQGKLYWLLDAPAAPGILSPSEWAGESI